ncbi:MAG: SDR family oxidoreductase [Bacteroidales bacterium]|nr:SDR family oxidoreductase [Bacteroidales bacterium]MCF8402555.1 SDR family oxidoreductase [Bacteroidales bacterium]
MKILITGASRGIGKYLLNMFKNEGTEVFGTYFSTAPEKKNSNLYKVNIGEYSEVKTWVEQVVKDGDQIVLINCAGTNYNSFAHKADLAKWKSVIDINLMGSFHLIHALLPYMRNVEFGRIINFASIVAQKGIPGTSAYAASKAALWGMTKSIAAENAKKGITINSLNLGYFNIGMITEVPEEFLNIIKKEIPKGDLGDPKNILDIVKFLINSDYTTGTTFDINGGLF